MSLHKFAEQVASQGRGDDSLLVHMTPEEVRNLQQFAQANGTTLTINPTTGLPEAGMLSDLFKAIAPIALGAFLGPAGAALGGGFMSAGMAGLAVGGITTLATGSLSRGLMAGLGAYGGAGLGESLMNAGTGALSQSAGAGLVGDEAIQQAVGTKLAAATPMETLTAGFNSATANPAAMGTFAKNNLTNIGMAAAPIMAMQPTTKMPDAKDTGYIRQFDYNINPDTGKPDPLYGMRAMTPVKASEFGNKTFQGQRDLFRQQNPNPYELGVGSLNQPPQQQPAQMNTGGIVALAKGGDYTTLTKDSSADDIASAYKQFTTAGGGDTAANQKAAVDYLTNLGIGQDKIGQAYGTYQASPTYNQYTNEQIGSYLTTNPNVDLATAISTTNANPADVNRYISNIAAPFVGSTETTGGSGTLGIYNQMNALGIDPNELYASRIAADPKYAGWSQADIARGYSLDKGALALAAADKDGVSDKEWAAFMDTGGYSVNDMAQAFGLSKNEVQRRYDAAKKVEKKTLNCPAGYQPNADGTACVPIGVKEVFNPPGTGITTVLPDTFTSVVPGGTKLPGATTYDNGAFGNYGSGNKTGVDYKGNTVSIATPGDIITNPDGTRTVVPNIPGRPYGGFTGSEGVKSAYTAGGGSLGYTAPIPKDPQAAFNKMTDDSLDAYNFLMGKGKNLTQRKAETRDRPVMQRYDEAVLGRKIPKLTKTGTTTTKTVTGVPGNPQSYFNEAEYLAANPDVAAEIKTGKSASGQPTQFTSGYEHYLMYGKAGGRAFTGDYAGYTTAAALANAANATQQGGGDGDNDGPGPGDGQGPGAGEGGGGATGDCVDPNVHILLADGGTVRAGDLKIGDMLYTLHDTTFVYGNYPVEYLNILQRPKVEALFDDGQKIIVSIAHKFLTADNQWEKISDIEIGTSIRGFEDVTKKLVSITDVGTGPVVEMVVTAAHTYISEGLVSHNKYYGGLVNGKAAGGMAGYAMGGGLGSLGSYSDGGRLLRGPGDGVSDSIPATIGQKQQPARLADGEFVIPARIVSELGNGSTDAGAKKLYAMMDRVQRARGKTTGKNKVAANSRSDKYLPA